MVFDKPIEDLNKADILGLKERDISEGLTIDYKEDLTLAVPDEKKRELLADIASFANAAGGHIVFGIAERRVNGQPSGRPDQIMGLANVNVGSLRASFENLVRDGIDPRVPGFRTVEIDMAPEAAPIVVAYVPRSFNAPHMVTLRAQSRFFARNSTGKYPLNVQQIRASFVASESLPERIRSFRADRLASIASGSTPVPMAEGPKAVLHVVPFSAFDAHSQRLMDFSGSSGDPQRWPPLLGTMTTGRRFNLDGFLGFQDGGNGKPCRAYTQFFTHGAVEAVSGRFFHVDGRQGKLISGVLTESAIIGCLDDLSRRLRQSGVEPPLVVMLSLIGVHGYRVLGSNPYWADDFEPIDRDMVNVQEVIVETYPADWQSVLKPLFDPLWQSAGWERSPSYDADGNWIASPGR